MVDVWHIANKEYVSRARIWRSADGLYGLNEAIRGYHILEDSLELGHPMALMLDKSAGHPEAFTKDYVENLHYWKAIQAGTARVFSFVEVRCNHLLVSFVLELAGEQPTFTPIWSVRGRPVMPCADFYTPLHQAMRAVERMVGKPVLRDPLFGSRMVAGVTLSPGEDGWQALADLKAACCRLQHTLDLPDDVILCEVMERYLSHRRPLHLFDPFKRDHVVPMHSIRLSPEAQGELSSALEGLCDAIPSYKQARSVRSSVER